MASRYLISGVQIGMMSGMIDVILEEIENMEEENCVDVELVEKLKEIVENITENCYVGSSGNRLETDVEIIADRFAP